MCGICGLVQKDGQSLSRDRLKIMTDRLAHRGPDGDGFFIDGSAGLGHRRLSIIDLKTGDQPMSTGDGRLTIVYNGEVYNYKELRKELEEEGETFATTSDTEVVLLAYRRWGTEAFRRFSGMFALAIWDRAEQELVLARDRFGIKPLYYLAEGGRFAFGSEIKALQTLPWWDRDLDPLALDEYFSYMCIAEPRTVFRAVRVFPPSSWGRVRDGRLETGIYWEPEFRPEPMSLAEARNGLDEALQRSVRITLRSDVPVGAFLSGGLDSGGVVSLAAGAYESRLKTFTVGFSDHPSYDEVPLAGLVARRWGTEHHELQLPSDSSLVPEMARRMVGIFDQPYADLSAIPQLQVAEFAASRVKCVLSGDGGDEVLGGYPTFYAPTLARLYRLIPGPLRRAGLAPLIRALPASADKMSLDYVAKRFVRGAELPPERAHYAYKEALFAEDKTRLYEPDFSLSLDGHDAYAPLAAAFARQGGADLVNRLMYADQRTFLLNDNLPKVDRTSMSVGLEVRLPLLNNEVVDFLLRLPPRFKVRPLRTKLIYRRLLKERLPREVITGRKKGFTPPVPAWFRGPLHDWAVSVFHSRALADLGIIRPAGALEFLEEHTRGRADHSRMLLCCLMLGLWAQTRA